MDKLIDGHVFMKLPGHMGYVWLSPCGEFIVDSRHEQPAIEVEFHLITCEDCE